MELTNSKTWKKNSTGTSQQTRTPNQTTITMESYPRSWGDSSNIGETLLGVIRRESVRNQSDFVNEGVETILDRLGLKSAKPLTRKEKLLAFIGFKAGSMWERLVEDQSQTEPASPNPIEWDPMLILKTNGKVC